MKSVLLFGAGALTLFELQSLAFLFLGLAMLEHAPTANMLAVCVTAVGAPLVGACLAAASFSLGLKRLGGHSTPLACYFLGLACALVATITGYLLGSLQFLQFPSSRYVIPLFLIFLVCFLAPTAIRREGSVFAIAGRSESARCKLKSFSAAAA